MRLKRVLYIATHVARAAAELHAVNPPILLRDLKPDNILIDLHAHPVIADFGCAGQAGMSSMVEQTRGGTGFSFTGRVVGTTRYMAPEQIGWMYPRGWKYSGFARVSSHADVWAFACTVGAMLIRGPLWGEADERMIGGSLKTWKVDFDAEEFKAAIDLPVTCPLPLKGIVEQCLVVPPYDRPSFAELATQLGRIVLPVERTAAAAQKGVKAARDFSVFVSCRFPSAPGKVPIEPGALAQMRFVRTGLEARGIRVLPLLDPGEFYFHSII